MYVKTTATEKIIKLQKRIRVISGGTAASKSISILLLLIDYAQTDEQPTLTSIVSESFPHLKRGVMRDFLNIMEEQEFFDPVRWNKTDYVYTFPTGSKVEFFSADQPSKVRGPRRDRLFINECNNVPYETFDQLEVRTKEVVFLDFNPVTEFWFYEHVSNRNDVEHIILTYKDNEALDPAIVSSIEQRRHNRSWWRVYGEGQLGEVEGKIYKHWNIIDELPHEAKLIRTGVDFGYSIDPTAIVDIYQYNQGFIVDEVIYAKGMSNQKIADVLRFKEHQALVIADSAEPKSIDEIAAYGVSILSSVKGPGSVTRGIDYVQSQKISVTKRSVNTIKEYRNYIFFVDKNGKIDGTKEDPLCANHSMSAIRYALESLRPNETTIVSQLQRRFQRNEMALRESSTR